MDFLGLKIWQLPELNAMLNTGSVIFLLLAFFFIRQRQIWWHRASILAALSCSALFLTSYLIYHYYVGHVPFGGTGWIKAVYLTILLSHIILAVVALPMILTTIWFALHQNPRHPKIGRVTLAIWLYVSITGVLVFWMLRPYAIAHFKALQANTYTTRTIIAQNNIMFTKNKQIITIGDN